MTGISRIRMSRRTPPPTPVIAPSTIASTVPTWWSRAVLAPVTQKSASPAASRTRRALEPSECGVGYEGDEAGPAGHREVAPVAERLWRNPDQQVACDPACEPDDHGEHHNAEDVQTLAYPGKPAAEPEDERPGQIEHLSFSPGGCCQRHGLRSDISCHPAAPLAGRDHVMRTSRPTATDAAW